MSWWQPIVALSVGVGAVSVIISAADMGFLGTRIRRALFEAPDSSDPSTVRRQRIERLQRSLRESASLLAELERDIADGQARVDDLQEQISQSAELAKLTQEQADAMRALLSDVVGTNLGRSERRTFWQQFALGFFFFALGVMVTVIVG